MNAASNQESPGFIRGEDVKVPISDEELDHQRDVLQAMLDSGIPMDDGGIAKALAVIERLDQAEIENVHLRRLVNHYVGITPLARITELEDALRAARSDMVRWGTYVPIRFQKRYGFRDDIVAIAKALGES